ncbi:MAG: hypothetical protein KF858_05155 [Candidatus Sumerlaeia bacterium]|nr:hypothetical protein [Candidatus Sumerlaeia bacterium]
MLTSIPTSALVLLNLIVIVFVVRERKRTQSGGFLLLNAAALILWSAGMQLWRAVPHSLAALWLHTLASLLICANLAYYAATRPRPLMPAFERNWNARLAFFLPAVMLSFYGDYGTAVELRGVNAFVYRSWSDLWLSEGHLPLLGQTGLLMATVIMLAMRTREVSHRPDRNLPRHLAAAIVAPSLFFLLFGIVISYHPMTLLPSPSLLLALIAQLAILVVIRQEEIERPLYLSRWIFYSITVLVGFFIAHLLFTLYESVTATVLLAPTVRATILLTIVVLVVMASIPGVQTVFDRLMFRRAWEYRQLVRAAQQELFETRVRLRRAERLSVVGEMAARIAHEIKNPLGPIKGYTQMMREQLERMDDFPQRTRFLRHLEIIAEEVETIDRKVRHLLDMSRQPALTVEAEDINRMVARAATLLRLEAESLGTEDGPAPHAIRVREMLDPALPLVPCNRPRLEEALYNLCRNAFEAVGRSGTITLRTRREQADDGRPGVAIVIEDDGPGFSEAARIHLFEPFYTEKDTGTGLGLSIVKSHVELHGGAVTFREREEGESGTLATLWLPLEPRLAEPTPLETLRHAAQPTGASPATDARLTADG